MSLLRCVCPCFFRQLPPQNQPDIQLPLLPPKKPQPTASRETDDGDDNRKHSVLNHNNSNLISSQTASNQRNRGSVVLSKARLSLQQQSEASPKLSRKSQVTPASVHQNSEPPVLQKSTTQQNFSTPQLKPKHLSHNSNQSSKDQFMSFKSHNNNNKSSSFGKRSLKVLRFHPVSRAESEMFESVNNLAVEICNDQDYRNIMQSMYSWVETIQPLQKDTLRGSYLMELDRLRKISFIEASNKIQEFQIFAEQNNSILSLKNSELEMEVELKESPKTFQTRVYTTLCKLVLKCPILWFLNIFNSPECQAKLSNFCSYNLVTKSPHLLLAVKQASNFSTMPRSMLVFKFSELVSEEAIVTQKKFIVEIDRSVAFEDWSGDHVYRRILRVQKIMPEQYLEVQIHTEINLNLKPGVDEKEFFARTHTKFGEHLTRMLKNLKSK